MSEKRDLDKDVNEAIKIADTIVNSLHGHGIETEIAIAALCGAMVDLFCNLPLEAFLATAYDMARMIDLHKNDLLDDEDEIED